MAITPFVSDIEMNKNIIYNPCFHISSENIANPKDGQYYLNSTDNKAYFYRETDHQWHKLGDNSIIYTAGTGINIDNQNVISIQQSVLDQINRNTDSIDGIHREIDTINQVLVIMDGKITNNTNAISALNGNLESMNVRVTTLEGNVEDLYSQLTNLGNRVNTNARNIQTNATEITNIKSRLTTDEANIQTNASNITTNANNISALDGRLTTAEDDIDILESRVTDLGNNKLDKNFTPSLTTGISIESNAISVKIKENKINPSTRATSSSSNELPLATAEHAGLATIEMVSSIADSQRRIEVLEQLGGHYIGRSFATVAELTAWTIPNNVNVGDFTYVMDDENHQNATTRYIVVKENNQKKFAFAYVINYDPVENFTQQKAGIILGKDSPGYVKAESNGTGHVAGWEDLNTLVQGNKEDIQTLSESIEDLENDVIDPMSQELGTLRDNVNAHSTDITNLQSGKVDKSKLTSVVTDVSLETIADQAGKYNVVNILETVYNAANDTTRQVSPPIQIPLSAIDHAGLMSVQDKIKLNAINEGAEVNQNAFSRIRVGSNVVSASAKTDAFELKAGLGIALNVTPANKIIEIENTARPIDTVATWLDNGLQSAYDKEREDKMGEEIWIATMNQSTGDYTIDVLDYDGYIGENSHLFVKFNADNITSTPKLQVISSTGSYELIVSSPIMKFGNVFPESGFILENSIWELFYDGTTRKFYMVAASGEKIRNYGFNNVAPTSGRSRLLAQGTVVANKRVVHVLNVITFAEKIATGGNIKCDASGMLEISLKASSSAITNPSLKWLSKSTPYKKLDYSTPVGNDEIGAIDNENFVIQVSGLNWKLFYLDRDTNINKSAFSVQYKLLNSTDSTGDESRIEFFENESATTPSSYTSSKFETVVTQLDANHRVFGTINVTQAEFQNLTANGRIIPGMLYNVTDDQSETRTIISVSNYNTFDPRTYSLNPGENVEIKAINATNFAVAGTTTSFGIMIAGVNTYTLVCQQEGADDSFYYRTFNSGAWGNWHQFMASGSLGSFIISSDASVHDIVTVTQSEYDDMLIGGTIDQQTMYNVTDESGSALVSRIAEFTDLTQLGVSATTNMQPSVIFTAMPDNSILYTKLVPGTFTLSGCTETDAMVEFHKFDSTHFYVRVITNKTASNPYIYE